MNLVEAYKKLRLSIHAYQLVQNAQYAASQMEPLGIGLK